MTIAFFLVPTLAGLVFVTAGALGLPFAIAVALPEHLDTLPLWAFFDRAGITRSLVFTVTIGFAATIISWGLNCLFLAFGHDSRAFQLMQRLLSPILAVPHITLAVGLLFLAAPSGIFGRLLALPFGWESPPLWKTNPDPYGLLLLLGLVMKELPFLFLLSLSALERIEMKKTLRAGLALGYSGWAAFFKLVYPRLYSQMRLPIFVVLAFSLSIVDMALILAPHAPVLLGVKILQWARFPDLSEQYFAAAGAFWMLVLTMGAIALWALIGRGLREPYRRFIVSGHRMAGRASAGWATCLVWGRSFVLTAVVVLILAGVGALAMLGLWSAAGLWPFPDLLPADLSWRHWGRAWRLMGEALPLTLIIAFAATGLSMLLAIGCLEAEDRYGFRPQTRGMVVLYLPLLVPQISFLFGVQILLLRLSLSGSLAVVIAGHMMFVLPYIYLSLAGPWRKLSPQFRALSYSLGRSPHQTLWRLILPIQLSALLTAFALGMSVSVALYLPTYLLGGGQYPTLTTEAIVLSSGGNRRIVSVYGLMQALVPWVFFTIAVFVPRRLYRHRGDMNVRA